MISAGVSARLFLKAAPNPEQYNLSKCLRQSSARGRREGFTRMGVPTQGCEIRDTRYGEVVGGNETLDTRRS